ncbi:hypothetical protein [Microvirga sp. M2]|uniref:hypothetical protein n=1 Tax=Microvirga sp. M2 TaxID=3073270 RepID=UPI0039C4BC32
MPVFELQGPDGSTYEVDAPDEDAAVAAFGAMGRDPRKREAQQSFDDRFGKGPMARDEGPIRAPRKVLPYGGYEPIAKFPGGRRFSRGGIVPERVAPPEPLTAEQAGSVMTNPEAANTLKDALQQRADIALVGEPSAFGQFHVATQRAANTYALNIPRNVTAAALTALDNIGLGNEYTASTFGENYQLMKDMEDATGRQHPKTAMAGTAAGIVGGMFTHPVLQAPQEVIQAGRVVQQGAGLAGRTWRAGATAGGYTAAAELADSKDPWKAAKAGAIGAAVGTFAQPTLELAGRALGPLIQRGIAYRKPDGSLTDEAANALREAGIDPREIPQALDEQLAQAFARKGVSVPAAREAAAAEFGIPLSRGQATDDVAALLFEKQALSGAKGDKAQAIATGFANEQQQAVTAARDAMGQRLGRGHVDLENPVEAGAMVGDAVRSAAAKARADFKGRYDDAFSRSGEFAPDAFGGIGNRIAGSLSQRAESVIIDDVVTPVAKRALDDIANARHLNLGDSGPVTLRGVEQARKRLVAFYKGAKSSGNPEDMRAVRSIMDEFDNRVERAVSNGMFSGDDGVLEALKGARVSYASYQKTFKPDGAGDEVGQAMRRIAERDATTEEIGRYLYGTSKIGDRGVSVRMVDRLQKVLGKESPEWSAIRQAVFMRVTGMGEGKTPLRPEKMAERVNEFLRGGGSTLAKKLFTGEELANMNRFANAARTTAMRPIKDQGGAGYAGKIAGGAMDALAASIGFKVGGPTGGTAALNTSRIGRKFFSNFLNDGKVERSFNGGAPKAPDPGLVDRTSRAAPGIGYATGSQEEGRDAVSKLGGLALLGAASLIQERQQ